MSDYQVVVLKTGYCTWIDSTRLRADGTISLVKGSTNIIVDTGGPWDRQELLDELKANSLTPEDIGYVVCTHGHSDHIGNINLFPHSTIICSYDICRGDVYTIHDFASGAPYVIDDHIRVIATPGHTGADVSVLVKSENGITAIVGDLFEDESDEGKWQDVSENPKLQSENRARILQEADIIIPGHGQAFNTSRE